MFNRTGALLLSSILVAAAFATSAGERDERKLAPPLICNNTITANIPVYMRIGGYPGVAIGIEYERFVNKSGTLSASLSLNRYWAGTFAHGELRSDEVRANIQGSYFAPGFFYHPAGNTEGTSVSIGAVFPLGSVKQFYTHGTSSYPVTSPTTTHTLAAALLQVNLRLHAPHFAFIVFASAGPTLSAGDTHGAMVLFGFKMGGRF